MKIKTQEIISSIEALNALLNEKLPATLSFKIGRLAHQLAPEVETYKKTRDAKMKEHGKPVVDENGNETDKYSFEGEGKDAFIKEMTELEDTEVEIDIPEIKIDDLGSITIEPRHLSVLTWLIK